MQEKSLAKLQCGMDTHGPNAKLFLWHYEQLVRKSAGVNLTWHSVLLSIKYQQVAIYKIPNASHLPHFISLHQNCMRQLAGLFVKGGNTEAWT